MCARPRLPVVRVSGETPVTRARQPASGWEREQAVHWAQVLALRTGVSLSSVLAALSPQWQGEDMVTGVKPSGSPSQEDATRSQVSEMLQHKEDSGRMEGATAATRTTAPGTP